MDEETEAAAKALCEMLDAASSIIYSQLDQQFGSYKRAPDDHPLFEVAQTVFEAALFVRAPYEWDEEEE
jgi:hypothetical protein